MNDPQDENELALRDEIGLAGLVNQLRHLEHRRVDRQLLDCVNVISPNSRPSPQITRPPISSVRPLMPRNSTDDRSGTIRLASPPACAARGALRPARPAPARPPRAARSRRARRPRDTHKTSHASTSLNWRHLTDRDLSGAERSLHKGSDYTRKPPDHPGQRSLQPRRERHAAGQEDPDAILDGDVGKRGARRARQMTMSPRYR